MKNRKIFNYPILYSISYQHFYRFRKWVQSVSRKKNLGIPKKLKDGLCVCFILEKNLCSLKHISTCSTSFEKEKRGKEDRDRYNPSIRKFLHVANKEICTGCLDILTTISIIDHSVGYCFKTRPVIPLTCGCLFFPEPAYNWLMPKQHSGHCHIEQCRGD